MKTAQILLPVFAMIALGWLCRISGFIKPDQKAGFNQVAIQVFFPLMIFNLMASARFQFSDLGVMGYVFFSFCIILGIAHVLVPRILKTHTRFAEFLLVTDEGGTIALPLYLSLVGSSTVTIKFDLAGCFLAFVVVPILVSRQMGKAADFRQIIKSMVESPFILAVLAGLLVNFTGLYAWLEASAAFHVYTAVMDLITTPLGAMILFCLGYDLSIGHDNLVPLLKLAALKVVLHGAIIAGFFVLFPALMADPKFLAGVLIYFMCPTGFGIPAVIYPLYQSRKDAEFTSSFISLYMLITLCVYTGVVLLLG